MKHEHDKPHMCPVCGLAPALPPNPLVLWGYEFLLKSLAPCSCGGSPVLIEGGSPKTWKYYCQNRCGAETMEYSTDTHPGHDQAILEWNNLQASRGFDLRKLHPLNQ